MTARVRRGSAKTTIAATYASTGVVLLALTLLVAFLLEPPLLGWVGFAVVCAIVLSLGTVATIAFPRMRVNPQRRAVALDHQSRLLVVADEHCGSPALWQEIYARLDGAVTVHLVVPVRVSHLHYLTNDEREESRDAEDRARLAIELLRQRGVSVSGGVGSDDPLESMTDALGSFPTTRVLLATSTQDDSYWMEQGLVAKAQALTPLQVDHVVVPPTPTTDRGRRHHRSRSEARSTMTRVSAEPASKPRRRRLQGQLRARQSGRRSESGSPGLGRLPLGQSA